MHASVEFDFSGESAWSQHGLMWSTPRQKWSAGHGRQSELFPTHPARHTQSSDELAPVFAIICDTGVGHCLRSPSKHHDPAGHTSHVPVSSERKSPASQRQSLANQRWYSDVVFGGHAMTVFSPPPGQ